MTNSEIQKIVETKIYPKYIQINKDQKDIPIWLKHCDKEAARQLKPLCEPYHNNPKDFFYFFWLPRSYENYDKNTTLISMNLNPLKNPFLNSSKN